MMKPFYVLLTCMLLAGAVSVAILYPKLSNDGQAIDEATESTNVVPDNTAILSRLDAAEKSIDNLQRALQAEQSSMLALQNELQDLHSQIIDMPVAREMAAEDIVAESLPAEATEPPQRRNRARSTMSNEAALIAAGVDSDTARELRSRIDRYTLAELEVRDTAAREGWLESSDYLERRNALLPEPVNIRQELGEQAWDSYLLASGRDNRVQVDSVIENSAAFIAGVEVGDLILEYADRSIFSIRELQQATRAGERGEVVTVRLGRGTSKFDTTIARGPLGVTLSGIQLQPVQ